MTTGAPSPTEINQLIGTMRAGRARLLAMAQHAPDLSAQELMEAIDAIGEQLLVADEELRVQNEHIAQSTQRLDLLVAMHEELFTNATSAYVQTDADGLILRFNAAARRLFSLDTAAGRSVTITSLVHPADRGVIRAVATRLRSEGSRRILDTDQPAEVTLRRRDGREIPAVVTARRSSDGATGQFLLHWEIQERGAADSAVSHTATAMRSIAEAAALMNEQQTKALTLERVVATACAAVPHCEEVGITLVRSRGRVETPAYTGKLAAACDEFQYTLREGPCLHTVHDSRPVRIDDMQREPRWPRFAPRAYALGVSSMLVLPLAAARGTVGALNLYSRHTNAFDSEDELIGHSFATHAAIALVHVELEQNLRTGLATRQEIGQAVGILMERHRVNAVAAFELLVQASQRSHIKLRDIASRVVETGEDPANFT